MKTILFAGAMMLALTGCAPPTYTVYGDSGKAFTAPDLCAALIACKKSTETGCNYWQQIQINADGTKLESVCTQVKK